MAVQLTLPVGLRDQATFVNFYPGDNQQAWFYLCDLPRETHGKLAYLWGASGSGRSHLLQASCHSAANAQQPAFYLSLKENLETPALLEGLENMAVVCIDDLDAVIGKIAWEQALFHLYNRIIANGKTHFIVAASQAPVHCAWALADLGSRMAAQMIFRLQALSDTQKLAALQLRAKQRGLQLPEESATYLLHHYPRDMHALFAALDKLDEASLASQNRLSVPFIKRVLI